MQLQLELHVLQPQEVEPLPSASSSSNKKFVLLFRSVLVAEENIESKSTKIIYKLSIKTPLLLKKIILFYFCKIFVRLFVLLSFVFISYLFCKRGEVKKYVC